MFYYFVNLIIYKTTIYFIFKNITKDLNKNEKVNYVFIILISYHLSYRTKYTL